MVYYYLILLLLLLLFVTYYTTIFIITYACSKQKMTHIMTRVVSMPQCEPNYTNICN